MKLNFHYNNTSFAADLPPSMTLADMAAYIEAETGLPPTHQTLMHKFKHLSPSKTTTLEESNILENDMVVIVAFDPVADNLTRAYEENPEFFADVTMLYVKVSLNGHELPAFVDTGAQRSLITPALCERCDLNHLIDRRFKMQARGVGEKQSDGRIHSVPMFMNSEAFATSLTVLDIGGPGLLIGLDWMKRFKAKIDLEANGIFIGNTFVEFLNEWEVNKLQKVNGISEDAPLPVPTATKTTTAPVPQPLPLPLATNPGAASSTNRTAAKPPVELAASLSADQTAKLKSLVDMGFDRASSLQALQACGWNVDMAAGMMF